MPEQKNNGLHAIVPLVVGLALSIGVVIGYVIGDKSFTNSEIRTATQKYGEILNHIQEEYVDTVSIKDLSEHSYEKLLDELDPHTRYIALEEQLEEEAQLEKEFGGIGVEFTLVNDTIFILYVLKKGPADKAGIKSGDRIVAVENEVIAGVGITHSGIFKRLKGSIDSELNVTVKKVTDGSIFKTKIIRKRIQQRSVNVSYMIDKTTGYVKLNRFSRDASVKLSKGIRKLKNLGMTRLIFDLRGNSGGYLTEANSIVDEFIPPGDVIVYTMGRTESEKVPYTAEINGHFEDNPLILLIDENSASASEIVAGALQDNDRAWIIGRRSYGKGLVQTPITLSDGSGLRLTTSRYYTPSGRCIQKPYGNNSDYYFEHLKRFESGELFNADSIKKNDSLKYKTVNGRTVYGGGGITPDEFVPEDTTTRSQYYNKIFSQNVLIEFALKYAHQNAKRFTKLGLKEFRKTFTLTKTELADLVVFAEKKGIEYSEKDFFKSKREIIHSVKAYVAKEIWGNLGYFQVLHQRDQFVSHAIKSFDKASGLIQE